MPTFSVRSFRQPFDAHSRNGLAGLGSVVNSTGDAKDPRGGARAHLASVTIFIFFALLLANGRPGAVVLERPLQSSILGFATCAALLGCIYAVQRIASGGGGLVEESIPLSTTGDISPKVAPPRSEAIRYRRLLFIALAAVVRVHAFGTILKNVACSKSGVEAVLPIIVVLLEHNPGSVSKPTIPDGESRSQHLVRNMVPAAVLSWAALASARSASSLRSTVICPVIPGIESSVVFMQIVGLMLDAWMLHSMRAILNTLTGRSPGDLARTSWVTVLLFGMATAGIIASSTLFAIVPSHRHFLANLDNEYIWAIVKVAIIIVVLVLSGAHIMIQSSAVAVASLLSIVTLLLHFFASIMNGAHLYMSWMASLFLVALGVLAFHYSTRSPSGEHSQSHKHRFVWFFGLAVTLGWIAYTGASGLSGPAKLQSHPLRSLIATADRRHLEWADQAAKSKSLEDAVTNYKSRYHRHPPPGFDKWWEYATTRKSEVLDDFDLIEENLRPYWKMPPARIRQRVKTLLADTENECAEVSIRDGIPSIGQVKPTHKWMVEGIIKMMEPFVRELPDMDIAFNINDEPRVAVPYHTWEANARVPSEPESDSLSGTWSNNRASGWQLNDDEVEESLDMTWYSFKNIWRQYGSINCPPNSLARTTQLWDASQLCTSCYAPHSIGDFLSNWTLAGDPCHQPDLAGLHGFYLSPSAFKATKELLPIFSQSRTGGFADILYPTAWNYNDKIKYSPSDEHPDEDWDKKKMTLFWKGSATEGFSNAGSWRGQTRQRIVNLANNSTQKIPVLLPGRGGGWEYLAQSKQELFSHPGLKSLGLTTDISFVDKYPRCADGDCEAQRANFGLGDTSDFQDHWKHKFLFDADGAGFSGRFLPFLFSKSLPLKTAIFREWYDSRITPWKHFVPIDVRLHGLWSTLAFFAARFEAFYEVDHGRFIANDGAAWARRVLRKEDMEIYFYRLLLEYARVTDDNRSGLGYGGNPK